MIRCSKNCHFEQDFFYYHYDDSHEERDSFDDYIDKVSLMIFRMVIIDIDYVYITKFRRCTLDDYDES